MNWRSGFGQQALSLTHEVQTLHVVTLLLIDVSVIDVYWSHSESSSSGLSGKKCHFCVTPYMNWSIRSEGLVLWTLTGTPGLPGDPGRPCRDKQKESETKTSDRLMDSEDAGWQRGHAYISSIPAVLSWGPSRALWARDTGGTLNWFVRLREGTNSQDTRQTQKRLGHLKV